MAKKFKFKLAQKISLLVVLIVLIIILLSISVVGFWTIDNMTENIERNVLNIVNITKLSPILINGLENPKTEGNKIQDFIRETQNNSEDIDIMVVADKAGIRYGHTVDDRLGKLFSAEDHADALSKGETYVSIGPGTLGDSMRAFAPIKNADGEILGFVMAGSLLTSINKAEKNILLIMAGFILFGLILGLGGAVYTSNTIKRSLLGFEPEDIARLYSENKTVLATIKEGVVAIDENQKITLINERAMELLKCEENIVGKNILDIFPQSKLLDVLISNEPILDYQYALNGVIVNSNNIPIINKGVLIGGVSSFRDQTEMIKLAEEITGIEKVVDSLRATTHEFKNKLHVILGYIETNRKEDAIKYISKVNDNIQNNVSHILNLINEPTLAALLIGKFNRGSELNVNIELDNDSYFDNQINIDINSIIVIVGNLLDNSLENLDEIDKKEKNIKLYINEEEDLLYISIEDNGSGFENVELAFSKGYTTKKSGLGYGLHLVKNNVEKYNGEIQVESIVGVGTKILIVFKKE